MTGKDFQKWHYKKAHVDGIEKRPFFHEREIWFCCLGANVGNDFIQIKNKIKALLP